MTVLALPDRVLQIDATTKKLLVGYDCIVVTESSLAADYTHGAVTRFNHKMEIVWTRTIFMEGDENSFRGHAVVITKDRQYVYVCGKVWGDTEDWVFKLDANTGETVWVRTHDALARSYALVLDSDDNLIVAGETLYKLSKDDGAEIWSQEIFEVVGSPGPPVVFVDVAVDSNNDVYVVHRGTRYGYSDSDNMAKIDGADGTILWQANTSSDYRGASGIAITSDDRVFVVGDTFFLDPNESLWEIDPDNGDVLNSADAGTVEESFPSRALGICLDADENVITSTYWGPPGKTIKWTQGLVEIWGTPYAGGTEVKPRADGHNRIWLMVDNEGHEPMALLNPDKSVARTVGDLPDADGSNYVRPRARAVAIFDAKLAEHTDQETNLRFPDMCCFLDDMMPKWDGGPYDEGDIVWYDASFATGPWLYDTSCGIFQALEDMGPGAARIGADRQKWKRLSRTAPCQNPNWNADAGIAGGIGGCPQIYTLTAFDIKNTSDDGVSEFNGAYLLFRGAGQHGYFYHYDHDRTFRIDWSVQEHNPNTDNNNKISMRRENGDLIFAWSSDADLRPDHDEKPTNVSSSILKEHGEESYGGTCSLYPGRIEQWDAYTLWEVDRIVAWQGRFRKALNPNVNSEPPSGDWAVL